MECNAIYSSEDDFKNNLIAFMYKVHYSFTLINNGLNLMGLTSNDM